MIAIMCDICKSASNVSFIQTNNSTFSLLKVCYSLCCPHGYHYIQNPDFSSKLENMGCGPGSNVNFSALEIWDGKKT